MKSLPLGPVSKDFINRYPRVYIVDQNRDGQLYEVIRMDIAANECFRLRSVRHYDGMPIPASTVVKQILTQEKNK